MNSALSRPLVAWRQQEHHRNRCMRGFESVLVTLLGILTENPARYHLAHPTPQQDMKSVMSSCSIPRPIALWARPRRCPLPALAQTQSLSAPSVRLKGPFPYNSVKFHQSKDRSCNLSSRYHEQRRRRPISSPGAVGISKPCLSPELYLNKQGT